MNSREFLELAHQRDVKTLQARILAERLPESGSSSATKLRNRLIVGLAAKMVSEAVGQRCIIATARMRAGLKGNLLHPVATWPHRLNSFFLEPKEYMQFSFDAAACKGDSGEELNCGKREWHGRLYDLKTLDDKGRGTGCFAGRISTFLGRIEGEHEKYGIDAVELGDLRERGTCLVFGGVRQEATFVPPRPNRDDEFYYFFSMYLLPEGNNRIPTAIVRAQWEKIGPFLSEMFRAIEISEGDDKEDFVRDGLVLVSELIPALASSDVAPSDAVTHFLRRFEEILQKHTLGIEDQHTWVRFVAIDTVFDKGNRFLTPRFQVFPHHAAAGSPSTAIGAFLISHPKRLSTAKLITRQWAQKAPINLHREFEAIFDDVKVPDNIFDETTKSACFSADDDVDLWRKVNLDVVEKEGVETRCTLGFVIEKELDDGRMVPYAIVAFESDIPDAFSQQDIVRLRNVIDACSALLLGLQLSTATFDIKQSIRDAYTDESTLPAIGNAPKRGRALSKTPFGKFRFELLRVDRKLLMAIVKSTNGRIWDGSGLTQADAQKYLGDVLEKMPGGDDMDVGDERDDEEESRATFNKTLGDRTRWINEHESVLHTVWSESGVAGDIYEFLSNVPSNIVWHCYLSAVSRAIAFRTGPTSVVKPSFTVMKHGGRSALAMFVFSSAPHEFRQIVKLSDRKRISQEEANYREYVRYSVPLSARLPSSGKAYESDGNISDSRAKIGKILRGKRSFGALVSDLIAGSRDEQGPVTFLKKVNELIGAGVQAGKEIEDFQAAIKYQFDNNVSRWKNFKSWLSGDYNVEDAVRDITRVRVEEERSLDKIESRLKSPAAGSTDYLMKEVAERLTGARFEPILKKLRHYDEHGANLDRGIAAALGSVIHGDLNAGNLVWSKDYVKFFMIDFERVRVGFQGADQLRLAFSLFSDLVVDGYLTAKTGPSIGRRDIRSYIEQIGRINSDVTMAIDYARSIMVSVKNAPGDSASQLPDPPSNSISAIATKEIFSTFPLQKHQFEFWSFAVTMTAAKQLEYALRELDASCYEALGLLSSTEPKSEDTKFNFLVYYGEDDLVAGKHDRFVLGKIARVLFAYRALAKMITVEDQ
jgi:hypothetical protein